MSPNRRHACARCRASKLRCLVDTFGGHGKCRRCFNADAECVFESVAPRARRKRTDTRVAALEAQIAGMKAAMGDGTTTANQAASHQSSSDQAAHPQRDAGKTSDAPPDEAEAGEESPLRRLPSSRHNAGEASRPSQTTPSPSRDETSSGIFDGALISIEKAMSLFEDFKSSVNPTYPILMLSEDDDFDALHKSQPILLLSMITAASGVTDALLFRKLHERLLECLADQVLVRSRRSIALVQAILIMEVWYDPPDDMERLNFYLWIQIVGTMARQLGLWPWGHEAPPGIAMCLLDRQQSHDELIVVGLRTAFTVYLSMSTVAISLRRPNGMPLTSEMKSSLETFDQVTAHPHDKRLIAWVRLQMIAEDVEACRIQYQAQLKNTSTLIGPPLVDQSNVSHLETCLSEWRDAAQPAMNESLLIHFYYCRVKLYELAVFICQTQPSPDQAHISPYGGGPLPFRESARDMAYVRSVMSLVKSSHGVLDTLLHLDTKTYRQSPTVNTVRGLYAIHELYLLWKSVHSQETHLAGIIDDQVLELKLYVKRTHEFFKRNEGAEGFPVPRMALASLANISEDVVTPAAERTSQQRQRDLPTRVKSSPRNPSDENHASPNDLDAILPTDITRSEPSAHSSTPGTVPPWPTATAPDMGQAQMPVNTMAYADIGGGGYDIMPMLSEFDIMAMPNAAMDPNWLFTESESYHRQDDAG